MDRLAFATYLAPNVLPVYEAVVEAVGRHLDMPTDLVVETSYESCRRDIYEACFVCSLPYLTFEREGVAPARPVAAPVLKGDRYGDRPIYFSDVIVARDAPFRSLQDLEGGSWAYNEPLSWSGYGITRYHLVSIGRTDGFFGRVVEAGFHEEAIRLVAKGEVDASAIDSQVLAVALRDDPALHEALRVIDSLGPSTIQPVAVSNRVASDLRRGIVDALVSMSEHPRARRGLDAGLVERFVPVGPSDYDDIRQMLDATEAAGFTVLR
jgi:phosphonate transport system substrate-binding protein